MSYDVWLEIDTGGPEPARIMERLSYTYNVSPVLAEGFDDTDGIRIINGLDGAEAAKLIQRALTRMREHPEWKKHDPQNGWDSMKGAMAWLQEILDGCRRHPKATVRVS